MSRIQAFFFLCRCLSWRQELNFRGRTLADEIRAGGIRWERVIELSSEYLMTVALYAALAEKQLIGLIPADLLEYFETIHRLNGARNQAIVEQSFEIARVLNGIGVEPLVFKGAGHLTSCLYRDPAIRIMSDIDILVPEDRAVECWDCLIASGYRAATAVTGQKYPPYHGPGLRREGRIAEVELHRCSPWPRILSVSEMYGDSQLVVRDGVRLRCPSATAGLINAVAHPYISHTAKRRGVMPLRDLFDTALLTREKAGEIEWQRVVRTFEDAGQADALRTHSMMLESLLGQPISAVSGAPRSVRWYWCLCLWTFLFPVTGELIALNVSNLGDIFADNADGRRVRKELLTPATYPRKLRTFGAALKRRGGGWEDPFKS